MRFLSSSGNGLKSFVLVMWHLGLVPSDVHGQLEIFPQHHPLFAEVDQPLTLTCQSTHDPPVEGLRWSRSRSVWGKITNQSLDNGREGFTVTRTEDEGDTVTSVLVKSEVSFDDAASYECSSVGLHEFHYSLDSVMPVAKDKEERHNFECRCSSASLTFSRNITVPFSAHSHEHDRPDDVTGEDRLKINGASAVTWSTTLFLFVSAITIVIT